VGRKGFSGIGAVMKNTVDGRNSAPLLMYEAL